MCKVQGHHTIMGGGGVVLSWAGATESLGGQGNGWGVGRQLALLSGHMSEEKLPNTASVNL